MTDTNTDFEQDRPRAPRVRLVEMTEPVLVALSEGDVAAAGRLLDLELGDHFDSEEVRWVTDHRLGQLRADPACAGWLTNVTVDADDGRVVGFAGFHGPPDGDHRVEVGYSVAPEERRRGYARATLTELLRKADASSEVAAVLASIRPDNVGSLATIAGFGFERVGEKWDERDGLEHIYERPSPAPSGE